MKIIRWWVEPNTDHAMNGGYASSVAAARDAACDLLEMEPGQNFRSTGHQFRFELLEMEGRKWEIIKELNWAVNSGWGGSWL